MTEWPIRRLGDLVEIKHGWAFKSDYFSHESTGAPVVVAVGNFRYDGGFRFDSTSVNEYRSEYPREYELRAGDILLIMTCQTAGGEILGIPGRVPNDGRLYLHNQRLGKVVIKAPGEVDPDFLYQLFRSPMFNRELVSSASGTKILHTAPTRIEAFRFPLPPLAEQRAIAEVLGALDDKIELNERMNATLDEMARALFKSWFVDFDPVRAKAEGRQPSHIDTSTAGLFSASFEDSPLGPIPEGWRVGEVGDVAESIRDSVRPADVEAGTAYVGLDHIPRRSLALTDWGDVESVISGKVRFRRGDILFGRLRPYFSKVVVAPIDGVCSSDIVVCRPKNASYLGIAATQLAYDTFIDYCDAASTGTKMPRVSWDDMSRYPMALPDDALLDEFNALVEPGFSLMHSNVHESRTLAELRDTLLPKLISGELRVGEAARAVEVAV